MRKSSLLVGTTFFAVAAAIATPAMAQDAPAPAECVDENNNGVCDSDEEGADTAIVVTGTRIARPTLSSSVPVVTVSADELVDGANTSLGDALNDLPSLRSTFSTANSQRFIGTTGISFLDLRGLGTSRTLILVNGRRHVTSSAGSFQVDVNTIPFELLERTDIVTGGSSAVYGSDAIAGVVNFILRRDFDGIRLNAQGSVSDRGDRGGYFVSGTFGRNFADGRGNIAVAAEYSRLEAVPNVARPRQSGAFDGFRGFVETDVASDETAAGDGIPDLSIRNNLRYNFISNGGTFTGICVANAASQPLACDANGQDIVYRFNRDGRLVRGATPTDDLRLFGSASDLVVGGDGATLSDSGSLFPQVERYSINLLTRFDVSDAFRPYAEFKYARINAELESSPSFTNGFCGGLSGAVGLSTTCYATANGATQFIRYDNAFLNPADVVQIRAVQNELLAQFGVGPASTGFTVNRNNLDFGPRGELLRRETYRGVVGFEGSFNDDWSYDVSMTYGRFEAVRLSLNNLITANFRRALDSVLVNGVPTCRVNADADPANNDAACVPINIFGEGRPSQAALNYVNTTSRFDEKATQLDILATVNGDFSQLFELPGGPISFAAGVEYRRETAFFEADPLSRSGATFLNAFPTFDPPTYKVFEAFGELQFPLLENLPFARELTVTAAGRISDYGSGAGATGTVEAWNLAAIYAPIDDIRFRVSYSRAVRAPTPSDLFTPQLQNFAFLTDPCDRRFINSGIQPNRLQNCRANSPIGNVPATYQQATGNRSILQGGNPNLEAEISNSLTVGAVFEPRFIPGLTLTVDYYDIEVENLISTLSGSAILQNCYDSPNLSSALCAFINPRNADGSFNQAAALTTTGFNFAKLTARGIDFEVRYERTFDNNDRLVVGFIGTRNLERVNFLDVNNPQLPNDVRRELGDPNFAANFSASYRTGPITIGYDLRYIGRMTIGTVETQFPFTGLCPASGQGANGTCTPGELTTLPPQNADFTAEVFYPDVFYHDIRLDYRVGDRYTFYVGVDNLTDQLPPFGLTGAGAGSGIYDNIGRTFFAGARVRF